MNKSVACCLYVVCLLLVSCGGSTVERAVRNYEAENLLQGVWLNDDTEMPILMVKHDSIYYPDPQNLPVAFEVRGDSIYFKGHELIAYKIDRQTPYTFWFHAFDNENVLKLHKSEVADDTLAFVFSEPVVVPLITEVTKKDNIVTYQGTRYRGYVYINPTSYRVTRTVFDQNGLGVDNVYYDNIIHICVYDGKKLLYGKDITKDMFSDAVGEDMLGETILADMDFVGVDQAGYHYQAVLGIPGTSASYIFDLVIDKEHQLKVNKTS